MPQPTIINAGSDNTSSDTTAYLADSETGAARQYSSISIPANANTVCFHVGLHVPPDDHSVDSITATGGGVEIVNFIPVAPDSQYRTARILVIDVSHLGAFTCTVNITLNTATSSGSILGVVCTDGFLESISTTVDRQIDQPRHVVYSPNYENNIIAITGHCDDDVTGHFTMTTGTALFEKVDSKTQSSSFGFSQSTNSSGTKTVQYASDLLGFEATIATYVFSSQKNPFEQQGGGVIRSVIRNI
jgi:hypothetical protein